MRKSELPAWAAKYDRKGLAFRKRGDAFRVYEVSSKRTEGKAYPVLTQKYIGTLTEKDGLLPARTKERKLTGQLECCLSHFVIENFGREIKRSFFNSGDFKDALLRAAVIGWMFGCIPQKRMIPLSASSIGFEEKMEKVLSMSEDRMKKAVSSVDRAVSAVIKDPADLAYLRSRLLTCTVPESDTRFPGYPEDIAKLLATYGGTFR